MSMKTLTKCDDKKYNMYLCICLKQKMRIKNVGNKLKCNSNLKGGCKHWSILIRVALLSSRYFNPEEQIYLCTRTFILILGKNEIFPKMQKQLCDRSPTIKWRANGAIAYSFVHRHVTSFCMFAGQHCCFNGIPVLIWINCVLNTSLVVNKQLQYFVN